MDIAERWLPIPDWEGIYEISDLGRVRGLERQGTDGRCLAAKFLSISRNNEYLVAYLCRPGQRNKSHKFYIEAAIESLFGKRPEILDCLTEPGEKWREIPGYEGLYEGSTHGRLRSIGWYVNGGPRRRYIRPKLRKTNLTNAGYMKTELAVKGKVKTISVHRLIATTFIPNPTNLEVVHHIDENKLNNRADNLEWTSRAGNVQDWFDRRRVVISAETIAAITAAAAAGKTPAEILAALPRKRKSRKPAD